MFRKGICGQAAAKPACSPVLHQQGPTPPLLSPRVPLEREEPTGPVLTRQRCGRDGAAPQATSAAPRLY
jgi:hypothetical protein